MVFCDDKLLKLIFRNSELNKDAAASFMIHCRGNPTPDIKIFKVLSHFWWISREDEFKSRLYPNRFHLNVRMAMSSWRTAALR